MSEDEKVDGPRVAARLLNSMPAEHKQHLLARIRNAAPKVSQLIEANIISYEDIAELPDQSVQRLISELDHRDLVLSLKKAGPQAKNALLRNMSQRKRQIVLNDLESLPPTPAADVEAAERRIVLVMERLRTAGAIHRREDDEEYV